MTLSLPGSMFQRAQLTAYRASPRLTVMKRVIRKMPEKILLLFSAMFKTVMFPAPCVTMGGGAARFLRLSL